MSVQYKLPSQVFLTFARGADPNPYADPGTTRQISAQWQRSFTFLDAGAADHLFIAFGSRSGELTASDLMLAANYAHTANSDSAAPSGNAGQLWLPNDLTPVSAGVLQTVDVSVYFHADASGIDLSGVPPLATFPCVARPEQVQPTQLERGIVATTVAWRWEIIDDTLPVIGS